MKRAELQQKLNDNLSRLEQLKYFDRVISTRHRVAEANTYKTEEYRQTVLDTYQKYLLLVTESIQLRSQFDPLIQAALRDANTDDDEGADGGRAGGLPGGSELAQLEAALLEKDESIRDTWQELNWVLPDSLDANLDLESIFLTHAQDLMTQGLSVNPKKVKKPRA